MLSIFDCLCCVGQFHSHRFRRSDEKHFALICLFFPASHYAHFTLHCLSGDSSVRCEQLDLLLQWGAEFRQSSSQSPEGEKVLEDLVAFDVILGDLNFDNCSSGIQLCKMIQSKPKEALHYFYQFTAHHMARNPTERNDRSCIITDNTEPGYCPLLLNESLCYTLHVN